MEPAPAMDDLSPTDIVRGKRAKRAKLLLCGFLLFDG